MKLMYIHSNLRGIALALSLLAGVACSVFPGGKDTDSDDSAAKATVEGGTSQTFGNKKVMELTASYEKQPVDVVIIRENSNYIARAPFAWKLFREEPGYERVFLNLATRFYFSESDFRIGVLESVFNNDEDAATKAGHLITGPDGNSPYLTINTPGFIDSFLARLEVAPGEDVSTGVVRNNANFNYPLKVIEGLFAANEKDGSSSHQFLRPEARLSILYVGYLDQIKEATDTQDIIDILDEKKGINRWSVSVIAPPKEGCDWKQDPEDADSVNTNSDRYAANSDTPEDYQNYKRKAKMIRLQKHSGGRFISICEDSYKDFINQYYSESTGNGFFNITPDGVPEPDSIEVLVENQPVEGWVYHPGTNALSIPTTILNGSTYHVVFTLKEGAQDQEFKKQSSVEEIPKISERTLNPSEQEFNITARAILQSNGCIGCHGGYANYQTAWNARTEILQRINLPDSDPGSMPQNSTFDSPENKQSLIDWLSMPL